jgi:cytochrome c-type biogenesis protein
VTGPAIAAHRLGAVALAAGLVVSFTALGLFLATIGFSLGLDADQLRLPAALLLGLIGLVLLSGALQRRFEQATAGFGNAASRLLARLTPGGLGGQFVIGLLLGAIWTPCAGPTLGAASLLAAQGKDLPQVAAVMVAFGVGSALPLLALGAISRQALQHWRGRLMGTGQAGRVLLGGATLTIALLILTGTDRHLEAALVDASPPWLTDLTTRF